MTDVDKAAAVVSGLEAKRSVLIQQGTDLEGERSNVALAAHTGDAKARKRLNEINTALGAHSSELASLDAALKAAGEHVVAAQAAAERAAAQAAAKEVREHLKVFVAEACDADSALEDFAESVAAMREALRRVHSLGVGFPSDQQLLSLGKQCLLTAIGRTPWQRDFELLAPNQRRDFAPLCAQWAEIVEARFVRPTLGEPEQANKDEAA